MMNKTWEYSTGFFEGKIKQVAPDQFYVSYINESKMSGSLMERRSSMNNLNTAKSFLEGIATQMYHNDLGSIDGIHCSSDVLIPGWIETFRVNTDEGKSSEETQ